jgi:hypothetical protein
MEAEEEVKLGVKGAEEVEKEEEEEEEGVFGYVSPTTI